jgi:hypothetical protein
MLKTDDVKSWAGLWMRVDYYDVAVLAFIIYKIEG